MGFRRWQTKVEDFNANLDNVTEGLLLHKADLDMTCNLDLTYIVRCVYSKHFGASEKSKLI